MGCRGHHRRSVTPDELPTCRRRALVVPLLVVELEVILVGEGDLEPEAPVPGSRLSKVEVGLPAMEVSGQADQVVVERYLQPIKSRNLSIRFFNKQTMSRTPMQQIKGHAGMLPLSTPIATAFDLVRYANRIGGVDSVATVLSELTEVLRSEDLQDCCRAEPSLSVVQRLGWIMDEIGEKELADVLYNQLRKAGKASQRALLDPSGARSGNGTNRWKVIKNINLDLDI